MRFCAYSLGRPQRLACFPFVVVLCIASVVGGPSFADAAGTNLSVGGARRATPSSVRSKPMQKHPAGYDWQSKGHDNTQAAYEDDAEMSATIAPTLGVNWMTNLLAADVGGPTVAFNPTFGKTLVYSGNERGDLSAIDEATGQAVWSSSVGAGDSIYSTPLISSDESSVWFGTAFRPTVYKLNTATGEIQCAERQTLEVDASATEGAASDGTEQVYISQINNAYNAGPLLAFRESDCTLMFSSNPYKTPDTGAWASASYGIDANGRRLVFQGTTNTDDSEYAIDATTGELDWYFVTYQFGDYDIGAASTVSPPGKNGFADGVVYVVGKDEVCYALDLTTGKLIWKFAFGSEAVPPLEDGRSTAALGPNTLVFGMSDGVFALNATTGAKLWHYRDAAVQQVISSPAIVGPPGQEVTAFADISGEFHVLRLSDGAELYHYQTGNFITASPSYYNGHFLITSTDGFLYDFAAGGGNGTLPTTRITSPAQGATLPYAGSITISGIATDTTGVSAVQVGVQMGGASGSWYNLATGTWNTGALTNIVPVANPGATSTTWSFAVPIPTNGTTLQVYSNAVNVAHLADITGAQVGFTVSASKSEPRLRTSALFIAPGATFVATGYGFGAGELVNFSVAGAVIGSGSADSTGKVSASLTLPTTSLFGDTPLTGTGTKSRKSGFTPIEIANAWLQAGYDPGESGFEPNDLTLQHLIAPGGNIFLGRAWYYDAGVAVESSPAVFDGAVFFGDDAGTLASVGTDTAAALWTVSLPSGAAIRSTPAIDPATGDLTFSADDGNIYVVTAANGTAIGSASIGGLPTSPTVHNGTIYVGSDNATLTSINEQTGTRNWTDTLAGAVHSAPAFDTTSGMLVVGDDSGAVSAFNRASGNLIWQVKTGGPVTAAPNIVNGIVYVGSTDGNLYAINEVSGASVWTFAAGTPIATGSPYDPILGLIYAGGANGILYAVNIVGGSLAWTTHAQNSLSPFVGLSSVNAFVIAEESNGSVVAFRSNQFGRFESNHQTGAALTTAPAINDGTVYVGASDGGVYAFTPYAHLPQDIANTIRRADSARTAGHPHQPWAAAASTIMPHFVWAGQRDVALHIDRTTRRNTATALAPLRYHGGPVQNAPRSYVVFWKPAGTTLENRYIPMLTAFLKGGNGHAAGALAGRFIDTAPAPAQMSDGALQTEIAKAIALNHWPAGVNAQFLILTASDMIAPSAGFCSYHSAFALAHDRAKAVVYAVIPYSGAVSACGAPTGLRPTGDPAIDAAMANLTRIQSELAKDPLLSGWYGVDGGEIGPGF